MKREKKNTLDHLKSSGTGFTVPQDYFALLEQRLKGLTEESDIETGGNRLKVKVRQLNNSGVLDRASKDHGFRVPDGYFEQEKFSGSEPSAPKVLALKSRNFKLFYLSAAATILLFFGIRQMNTLNQTGSNPVFQEEEIANWIDQDLVLFNDMEVAEVFSDIELEGSVYPEEEVYSYLNDMNIENLILDN